jgi:hypothetical protein
MLLQLWEIMLAIIAAILLVGIVFGIGLVAYAIYLTWEPDDGNSHGGMLKR